jgi:ABC-type dipeptide/oligopeptide/nickel transport system permease component
VKDIKSVLLQMKILSKELFLDLLKILMAMTLFLYLFFLFAPTPDLHPGVKNDLIENIRGQLSFFSYETIENIFADHRGEGSVLSDMIDRSKSFSALFLVLIKRIPEGLGQPLGNFGNDELPNIIENLIPHFSTTILLTLLGSALSILLSLGVSLWYTIWNWQIYINQPRKGSEVIFKGLSLCSNTPSCILGIILMFVLVSAGLYQSTLLKYLACGLVIGFADGIFCILSDYLKDELKIQFNRNYLPLAASRGSRNFMIREFFSSLSGKAIRNIIVVVISIFKQRISVILGLTIIVEVVFNINGMGFKSWELLHNNANGDYFQVMGIFAGFSAIWLVVNFICNLILIINRQQLHQ